MINPNKTYSARSKFKVVKIDSDRGLWLIVVQDDTGHTFEGYLDRLTKNPKRFAVGDVVKIGCRFSIMSDRFMISRISKVKTA